MRFFATASSWMGRNAEEEEEFGRFLFLERIPMSLFGWSVGLSVVAPPVARLRAAADGRFISPALQFIHPPDRVIIFVIFARPWFAVDLMKCQKQWRL